MSARIVCLPGDGIGPEVMEQAVRVLEALPIEAELDVAAVRRRCDRCDRRSAAGRHARGLPRRRRGAARRRRRAEMGPGRAAPRGGPPWAAQGARRLCEPAPGRRPADRARARRRAVLRGARHAGGRHRLRHVRIHAGAGRAGRAPWLRARSRAPRPARLGRQGERARHVAPLAARRHRARSGLSGRAAPACPRRQLRDGARRRPSTSSTSS